jgi:hypothetical protein
MRTRKPFFFFFSLETQSRRRALVIAFYGFFAALTIGVLLWRGPSSLNKLLQLAVTCTMFLGGITAFGPVRPFSRWHRRIPGGSTQSFVANRPHPWLAGRRLYDLDALRFDEHDMAMRDRAHYLAYAAMRWPILVSAMLVPAMIYTAGIAAFARLLLLLCFPFCVLFLSLPQAIILWTEPDLEPDPEDPGSQTVIRVYPQENRHA